MYSPKYFTPKEFEACFPPCSISQMDETFLRMLDELRSRVALPLVLNCAYRSPSWDVERGRSGSGYHTKGRAVDVRCQDSSLRAKVVASALALGLSVGMYRTFLHIDNREKQSIFIP